MRGIHIYLQKSTIVSFLIIRQRYDGIEPKMPFILLSKIRSKFEHFDFKVDELVSQQIQILHP
jgi:hypothetical protein